MKSLTIIVSFVCLSFYVIAQDKSKKSFKKDSTKNYIKEYPHIDYYKASYVGGSDYLEKYINKNFQHPETLKKNRIEGKIFVMFLIDVDGSCPYAQILKGLREDYDNEILRVIQNMPKWNPGRKKDSTITYSWITLPVNIQL